MSVTLRPIDKDNWQQCIKLAIKPEQKGFVAPNLYSIAQAQFYPDVHAEAIYAGDATDTMVGFVMWGEDIDDNPGEMWIWRLMIDAAHQGQGYGRAATLDVIRRARAAGHPALYLSYEPENTAAASFYARLGFADTGRVEYGETVVRLDLTDSADR